MRQLTLCFKFRRVPRPYATSRWEKACMLGPPAALKTEGESDKSCIRLLGHLHRSGLLIPPYPGFAGGTNSGRSLPQAAPPIFGAAAQSYVVSTDGCCGQRGPRVLQQACHGCCSAMQGSGGGSPTRPEQESQPKPEEAERWLRGRQPDRRPRIKHRAAKWQCSGSMCKKKGFYLLFRFALAPLVMCCSTPGRLKPRTTQDPSRKRSDDHFWRLPVCATVPASNSSVASFP